MRGLSIILVLLLFNASTYAQWKSYYPDGKLSKKNQEKEDKEKNKAKFDNYFFKAIKAKSLEDYDEALQHFSKCIEIDNKASAALYESAIINAENGNHKNAIEQIKAATKLEPKNRWYLYLYAEILFSKQDFINAAEKYKKLITLEPNNEELYFKLSEIYIYSNNFKKAIGVYDSLEKKKGVDKNISIQKQKLYRKINDIKGAIKELKKITEKSPNDAEILAILAELYLLNDEKERAFELFKKLSIIDPNNGRIHLTLAEHYRDQGQNDKSYEELKLAFKSTKLNIDSKIRVLISYYQLIASNEKMQNQAYELAEILITIHPHELKPKLVLADILYTDQQYQKAKEKYLFILETEKSKNQVWGQVLFIQAEQNDFEGMLKTSKEALEYFPSDPLFYYFNAISNKWFKNYEITINQLETGIEFVVENQTLLMEFYSTLADTYHIKEEHELSDAYYEKVLELDPNNILVLNNYAYYLSLRKTNLEKAKKMSFKCNELQPNNGTYQDTYGWVLYALKEYKEAKLWLIKALSNGSDTSPVVVEHYGDVLYILGEAEEAVNQWKKAKSLGGNSKFLNKKIKEKKLYE